MAAKPLETLIEELSKLPGIGKKNAARLSFHILSLPNERVDALARALTNVKSHIKKCTICGNYSENDICDICGDNTRDTSTICVVSESRNIISFEKTGRYRGLYHVLDGKLEPLKGITPKELNIKSLVERISRNNISEIIFALDPDLDGDITTSYLVKLLAPFGIKITKIANGIPIGGNIEYSDTATISSALDHREKIL